MKRTVEEKALRADGWNPSSPTKAQRIARLRRDIAEKQAQLKTLTGATANEPSKAPCKVATKAEVSEPSPHQGSGTMCYYEGGYGNRSHKCTTCDGSGRVYEGGYGNRRCPDC